MTEKELDKYVIQWLDSNLRYLIVALNKDDYGITISNKVSKNDKHLRILDKNKFSKKGLKEVRKEIEERIAYYNAIDDFMSNSPL